MAYGVDKYPDPPEFYEKPEPEYNPDDTDRFEAQATRDCEAAIASIKSMNKMLDSIFPKAELFDTSKFKADPDTECDRLREGYYDD